MLSGEMVSGFLSHFVEQELVLFSQGVGESLNGGTEMPWPGRTSCGMGFGLLGAKGGAAGSSGGQQSWHQLCQTTAALWHCNVGPFVLSRFTLVPCLRPARCSSFLAWFLQGCKS